MLAQLASSRSSNAGRLLPASATLTSEVGSKLCHQHLAVGPLFSRSVWAMCRCFNRCFKSWAAAAALACVRQRRCDTSGRCHVWWDERHLVVCLQLVTVSLVTVTTWLTPLDGKWHAEKQRPHQWAPLQFCQWCVRRGLYSGRRRRTVLAFAWADTRAALPLSHRHASTYHGCRPQLGGLGEGACTARRQQLGDGADESPSWRCAAGHESAGSALSTSHIRLPARSLPVGEGSERGPGASGG